MISGSGHDFLHLLWAKNPWWRTPVAAWEKVKVSRCCSWAAKGLKDNQNRRSGPRCDWICKLKFEVWPGYERIWYGDQILLKPVVLHYCAVPLAWIPKDIQLISYDRIAYCGRNSFWSRSAHGLSFLLRSIQRTKFPILHILMCPWNMHSQCD